MKKRISVLVLSAALAFGLFAAPAFSYGGSMYYPYYRLFNPATGRHTYTTAYGDVLKLRQQGWTEDGNSWYCYQKSERNLHRLTNPSTMESFMTTNDEEAGLLRAAGWTERAAGLMHSGGPDPVYRFYNPASGEHLWTIRAAECDALERSGWIKEGVAFYAYIWPPEEEF